MAFRTRNHGDGRRLAPALDSAPTTKPRSQGDAYGLILQAIDVGIYRPGDRLVQSELAERFGVSRTPIREALQRLETQSLLGA